jgi:hypothetical protein
MQHFNPLEPMADGKPVEVRVTSLRAEPWPDGGAFASW